MGKWPLVGNPSSLCNCPLIQAAIKNIEIFEPEVDFLNSTQINYKKIMAAITKANNILHIICNEVLHQACQNWSKCKNFIKVFNCSSGVNNLG